MGRKRSKNELKAIHASGKGKAIDPNLKGKAVHPNFQGGLTGYNVKLKRNEIIRNPRPVTFKNGKKAVAGIGSDGTKIFRIVAS